jgi:hypothetical protein
MDPFDLAIVHGPCNDGTGAAWAVRQHSSEVQIVEIGPGSKLSKEIFATAKNKRVIIADVFPDVTDVHKLVQIAAYVMILDHHASAVEWRDVLERTLLTEEERQRCFVLIDQTFSGCVITWMTLFQIPNRRVCPLILYYLEDADLYKFRMRESRAINCYLSVNMLGKSMNARLAFLTTMEHVLNVGEIEDIVRTGNELLAYRRAQIQTIIEQSAREIAFVVVTKNATTIYHVWAAPSATPELTSDLGSELTQKPFADGTYPDFGVVWRRNLGNNRVKISLRGHEQSPDLNKLTNIFGGGGHPRASACWIESPENILVPWEKRESILVRPFLSSCLKKIVGFTCVVGCWICWVFTT